MKVGSEDEEGPGVVGGRAEGWVKGWAKGWRRKNQGLADEE